jgi:hypothetical protein
MDLLARLERGARAWGYPTDLWTLKCVAEVMRKEYGVEYTLSGVWKVLRALGLSAQVPLTIAPERDDRCIRRWVRSVGAEILDRPRRTRATLPFVDESGIQTSPNARRGWAKGGSHPVLRPRSSREKVVVIPGVTAEGERCFDLFDHDMTGTEVIRFL